MISRLTLGFVILVLAVAVSADQPPIFLGSDDIYFTFELAEQPLPVHGRSVMVHARTRLCGFQIRGNHRNSANPRVEWDLNIVSFHTGVSWTSGISAGTFDIEGQGRKPRSPITDLKFSIAGDPQSITARIVGAPGVGNGINALLETESADRLFAALSGNNHLITIGLTYADNAAEVIQIRGYHDGNLGARNSLISECLRGYTPIPGTLRHVP